MKANEYLIMSDCIENGVSYGWHRAHKHTENPTEEQIKEAIEQAVMSAIVEYFWFDQDKERE